MCLGRDSGHGPENGDAVHSQKMTGFGGQFMTQVVRENAIEWEG